MTVLDIFIKGTDDASDELNSVDGALGNLGATAGSAAKAGLAIASTAVVAVGTAAVAAGVAAVNLSTDINNATNTIATGLGTSQEEASRFEDVMKSIYANNFGESFDDIGVSIAEITRQMGEMPDDALQGITEDAFALRDAFEVDIGESAQAAAVLMEEMGLSGEQAMDFIAQGMQKGLNNSGDFLDSITEYGGLFSDAGFGAEEFFSLMESGAEAGVLGTDKIADAVKEMGIILAEGGDEAIAAFDAIGLSYDEIAEQVAAGNTTWAESFDDVVGGLEGIEDPIERSQAHVALFGTAAEDLGVSFTEGLSTATTSLDDMSGATESLNAQYDNWPSMWEGIKRSFLLALEPLGDLLLDIGNLLMPIVQAAFERIQTDVIPILEIWFEKIGAVFEAIDGGMTPLEAITDFLKSSFGPEFANAFGIAVDVVGALADVLVTVLGVAFDNLKLGFAAFSAAFQGDFQTFGANIGQAFTNSLTALVGILGQLWGWVKPLLAQFWESFKQWFAEQDWKQIGLDLIGVFLTGLATFAESAGVVIAGWVESLTLWVDGVDWVQVGYNVVTAIIDALKFFKNEVNPTLKSWGAAFKTWFVEYDWRTLAESAIDGLVNGLTSLKHKVIDAVKAMARGAWDAFADEIGWGSPAREWFPLGESMIGGIIGGVSGMIGQLIDTFAQVADAVEVDAAREMSEAITAVAGAVIPALDAIVALANFDGSLDIHDIMVDFKEAIFMLAWGLAASAAHLQSVSAGWGVKDSKRMAESVIVITEALQLSMDTIAEIANYQVLDITFQILGLVAQIEMLTVAIMDMSANLSISGLIHAQIFADAAGGLLDLVAPAIDALVILGEYVAISGLDTAVSDFAADLSLAIGLIATTFESALAGLQDILSAAALLTEQIAAILATVFLGLDALAGLSNYVTASGLDVAVTDFAADLSLAISILATTFESTLGGLQDALATAILISEQVLQIADVIQPGLDAIHNLADYIQAQGLAAAAMAFTNDLVVLVRQIAFAFLGALTILEDAIAFAGGLAESINSIVGIVQPGLDVIASLANYIQAQGLAAAAMAFTNDLVMLVRQIAFAFLGALTILEDAIAFAGGLADPINSIVGIIQPGLDAIIALSDLPEIANLPAAVASFLNALKAIVTQLAIGIDNLDDYIKDAIIRAAEMATSMSQIAGIVQPGIDAIIALSDLPEIANLPAAVTSFLDALKIVVIQLAIGIDNLKGYVKDAIVSAAEMVGSINQIVGVVQPGIDAIIALGEFVSPDLSLSITEFTETLISIVDQIATAFIDADSVIGQALVGALEFAAGANQLVDATMGMIDHINDLFAGLQELATGDLPNGISSIMQDVIETMQNAIEPAYQAGLDFGEAWVSGLREALSGIGAEFGMGGGETGGGETGGGGTGFAGGLTTYITLGGINVVIEGGSTSQETAENLRDVIIETIQDLVTG